MSTGDGMNANPFGNYADNTYQWKQLHDNLHVQSTQPYAAVSSTASWGGSAATLDIATATDVKRLEEQVAVLLSAVRILSDKFTILSESMECKL